MPRFRFIGDPLADYHGADTCELFGLMFDRVEWTDVSEPHLIERCRRHSHLEEDSDGESVATVASVATPKRRGRPPKVKHG